MLNFNAELPPEFKKDKEEINKALYYKNKKQRRKLFITSVIHVSGVISFMLIASGLYGLIAYVFFHFISKYW